MNKDKKIFFENIVKLNKNLRNKSIIVVNENKQIARILKNTNEGFQPDSEDIYKSFKNIQK